MTNINKNHPEMIDATDRCVCGHMVRNHSITMKKNLPLHRSLQNVSCVIVKIFIWNMRQMTKNKNCDCGHSKKEHTC